MTAFDALIIAIVIYVIKISIKNNKTITRLGLWSSSRIILAGLCLIAIFYFIDLFSMHFLPLFIGMSDSMLFMRTLHLNYSWFIITASLAAIALGLSLMFMKLLPELDSLLTQLRTQKQQLGEQANTETLTNLLNRRSLNYSLESLIALSKRNNSKFAILFIDLNDFKSINDIYGHAVGDMVLVYVAQCMSDVIRESDLVARMGGDEFVIVLSNIHSKREAEMVAEKLTDHIAVSKDDSLRDVSISVATGVSIYPNDGDTIDALMMCADSAMYETKRVNNHIVAKLDEAST